MCSPKLEPIPEDQVAEIMYRQYYQEELCRGNCNSKVMIVVNRDAHERKQLMKLAVEKRARIIYKDELSAEEVKEFLQPSSPPAMENYLKITPSPEIPHHHYEPLTKRQHNQTIVPVRTEPKIPRNAPCPCGSGNKYKRCCGR